MKSLQLAMGTGTVMIFLVTGLYMRLNFPTLHGGNEAVRFLYRANHIYILSAGLVLVVLGLYFEREPPGWRPKLQILGSGLCMLACPLLIAAFFIEPPGLNPIRPLTGNGLYALFGGVMVHVLSRARWPGTKPRS